MTSKALAILFFLFCCFTAYPQIKNKPTSLDASLAKKITVSGICLCQVTLTELQQKSNDLKPVDVEEMNLGKKCVSEDARFEKGKGYYSTKFPGMIFQKDQSTDQISKIRLTKDFKGNLPDGSAIDMKNLKLKDIFNIYPSLKDKWSSRGCSDYWSFDNDTLFFYVKIDPSKKPQFPIDEAYYYDKPIESIDLLVSCYSIFEKKDRYKQFLNDPVFFVDSVNVLRTDLQSYQSEDIAVLTVYKDSDAINLIGEQGKFSAIFIETKRLARNKYWNFFSSRSQDYLKIVPTSQSDSAVVYILNNKVLKADYEDDLSLINNETFIDLTIIDKQKLNTDYHITDKAFGVVIRTKPKDKKIDDNK